MPEQKQFRMLVVLNPLRFFAAEFPDAGPQASPDEKEILKYLTDLPTPGTAELFVKRYKELMSVLDSIIVASPADDLFLQKFMKPIQHAIKSYILGGYLGSIAMCGMVAEMSAILIYGMADKNIRDRKFTAEDERNIYGREYEKLGQERRVDILRALGFIDQPTFDSFEAIRNSRNRYLHYLSQDHSGIENDAKEALVAATRILHFIIRPTIAPGGLSLNPALVKYLVEQGIMEPIEESPAPGVE
jgi:hypothetical protein